MTVEKTIKVSVLKHDRSDLWMAVSEDMAGLVVHGRSAEEVAERVPGVLQDLLEADGHRVMNVELVEDKERTIPEFGPPAFVANASLCETV